jgi:hypothetical protein
MGICARVLRSHEVWCGRITDRQAAAATYRRARVPGNLTGFLRQARQGRSFLVMSHDQVLAEVGPPRKAERPPRCPGALRGKIRLAPDFDRLPADVLAAMEGQEG